MLRSKTENHRKITFARVGVKKLKDVAILNKMAVITRNPTMLSKKSGNFDITSIHHGNYAKIQFSDFSD